MSTGDVHRPIFARFYRRLSPLIEREVGSLRDELLSGLSGRVVEIGAGTGACFAHYPPTVDEVVAIEPEPYLRRHAERAADGAAVSVSVRGGLADTLPLDDDSFDAAVASLVLCTVPDQARALAELRRVLVPGGELRFLEHVRADGGPKARVQALADRSGVWPWLAGGCHCSRDTVAAIVAAGFEVEAVRGFDLGPSWGLTAPHLIGVARAPGSRAAA